MSSSRDRTNPVAEEPPAKYARRSDDARNSGSETLALQDPLRRCRGSQHDWAAGAIYGSTVEGVVHYPRNVPPNVLKKGVIKGPTWKYRTSLMQTPLHMSAEAYGDRSCVQYVPATGEVNGDQHLWNLAMNTLHEVRAAAIKMVPPATNGKPSPPTPRPLGLWLLLPNTSTGKCYVEPVIDAFAHLASAATSKGYALAAKMRMQMALGTTHACGDHRRVIEMYNRLGVINAPTVSAVEDTSVVLMGISADDALGPDRVRFKARWVDIETRQMDTYLKAIEHNGVGWNTQEGIWLGKMIAAIQLIGRDLNIDETLCATAATIMTPPEPGSFRKTIVDNAHNFFSLFNWTVPDVRDEEAVRRLEPPAEEVTASAPTSATPPKPAEPLPSDRDDESDDGLNSDDGEDEEGGIGSMAQQRPIQSEDTSKDESAQFVSDLRCVSINGGPMLFRITNARLLLDQGLAQEQRAQGPDIDDYSHELRNTLSREEVLIRLVAGETPLDQSFPGVLMCDPKFHDQVQELMLSESVVRIGPEHVSLLNDARAVMLMHWTHVVSAEPYLSLYVGDNGNNPFRAHPPRRVCPSEFPISRLMLTSLTAENVSKWFMEPCNTCDILPLITSPGCSKEIHRAQLEDCCKCIAALMKAAATLGSPSDCAVFKELEESDRLPKAWAVHAQSSELLAPTTSDTQGGAAPSFWDFDSMMDGTVMDPYGSFGNTGLPNGPSAVPLRDLAYAITEGDSALHSIAPLVCYMVERFGPLVSAGDATRILKDEIMEHGRLVSQHRRAEYTRTEEDNKLVKMSMV